MPILTNSRRRSTRPQTSFSGFIPLRVYSAIQPERSPCCMAAASNLSDSYEVSAKYYDQAYAAKPDLVDLPFYLNMARQSGGPVLELACGTGRVLLPTARAGIEIHGVENSAPMLHQLTANLEHEPLEVRKRICVFAGDMRTFRGKSKYRLVTIPFRPMQHMHTLEDQISALRTAAHHLDEDGVLAFDVFYPRYDLLTSGLGEEIFELEWHAGADPATVVRRYLRRDSVDKIRQNFTGTFFYRTFQSDKLLKEESEPLKLTYYTYPQLRALFLLAGLQPVAEYGSFARAPLDNDAQEMIFVLKKA